MAKNAYKLSTYTTVPTKIQRHRKKYSKKNMQSYKALNYTLGFKRSIASTLTFTTT